MQPLNDNPPVSASPPPRRRRRIARKVLLVLVIAIGLFEGWAYLSMKQAMTEARAGGEPLTFAEIEKARTPWPDARNGATVLLGIKGQLGQAREDKRFDSLPWIGGGDDLPLGERWSDAERALADRFLKDIEPLLQQIDRLKDFRGGRLPFDTNFNLQSFDKYELTYPRTAIKLKSLQVMARAMAGSTASLPDDLEIMLNTAQVLAEEPTLIGTLVYIAGNAFTVATLQQVCALTTLQPDQMTAISAMLGNVEDNHALYWGMLGERALGLTAQQSIGAQSKNKGATCYEPGVHAWLLNDQATCMRMYTRMIAAAKTAPDGGLTVARRIDQDLSQFSHILHPLSCTLLPSLTRSFEMNLRAQAEIRAARIAMAVERFRLDHKQFPASLEQLVPVYMDKVPADPFDQQPMRYRVTAEKIAIYSVGEDLKDDGGDIGPRTERNKQRKDWGFLLLPPELRGRTPATTPASQPSTTRQAPPA